MALSNQDRVLEKSETTGTGTYRLQGSPGITGFGINDYDLFSGVGDGNTCIYVAVGVDPATGIPNNTGWEVGLGTYTASGRTLARTQVYSSSNNDAAVSWGNGTRFISCTLASGKLEARLSADFTKANATLGNTNLVLQVLAGRSYRIDGYLIISNTTAGEGFKCDFDGGTCTATDFDVCLHAAPDSAASVVLGTTARTTLAGDMDYTTVTGTNRIFVRGSIKVNAAGTLILRAAESTTSTGTLTLAKGSWLALTDTINL